MLQRHQTSELPNSGSIPSEGKSFFCLNINIQRDLTDQKRFKDKIIFSFLYSVPFDQSNYLLTLAKQRLTSNEIFGTYSNQATRPTHTTG